MSEKLKEEAVFFNFLLTTNEKQQQLLLKTITKTQMSALIEIIYNALHGNLIISESDIKRVKRYKNDIRRLVAKGLSFKRRKELLIKYFKQVLILI